ncbi:sugar diacid recognition domain-containing protein [Oceanobacillus sp. FSL K6-0118]|uniref:CdaR family transcriptional regulator n=1 Tax=Oceanobacillus sp. FSL K6-0118 TaxID=2921418 RepID=UPI0030F7ACA2
MLTREMAETIVQEASLRVDRNVNIMNRNGKIIASCDPSRLNQIHAGALEVIKDGRTIIIYPEDKLSGAKPGINLPIVFQEKIIGVIGITGDPKEISEIGELVKMMTELMINQKYIASQSEWKQTTKDMLLEQLLKKELSYHDIDRLIGKLDFEFIPTFVTVIIQIEERSSIVSNKTLIESLENACHPKRGFIGVIHVNKLCIAFTNISEAEIDKKILTVYQVLKGLHIQFRLSYSLPFDKLKDFRESYLDCDLALKVSDRNKEIVSYAQLETKVLIHRLNQQLSKRFAKRILEKVNEENIKTLKAFLNHNLHIQKTAEELFIHRNTLIYRLNKISEQTGLDPRKFEDALSLQIAIWIYEQL